MAKNQSLQETVVKGSLTTLVLTLLGAIFAYLIRILYSHSLSVENYGLFYAVFGVFSIVVGYSDLGFGYAIVYLLPKYLKIKNYSKAWNIYIHGQVISLIMAVIISVILIVSAPFLVKYYFKVPSSENLIYIFCIYLISFTILNGLIQIFTGMQKVKYYSSITLIRWLLTFIFSILFFLFDSPNIIFYALSWGLGHIITAIIFLFFLLYKHPNISKNKVVWSNAIIKQMLALAFPVLMENFVVTTMIFADTFFLTLMKGVKEVGIYNIIYPLTSVSIILLTPINGLILPLVSHLMEGEREKLRLLINRILELVPFMGIYFSLFIILFPSSIVRLVFGQKWLGLVEIPLIFLSIGYIGILISNALGNIAIGTGRVKERLKANVILAMISVCLDILLVWRFGILGVVITNSLIGFMLSIWCIKIIKTSISFQTPLWFYLKILAFSIAVFIAVRLIGFSPKNWS